MRLFIGCTATLFLLMANNYSFGQETVITGKVFNAINKTPLASATLQIQGSEVGATTDSTGYFEIKGLKPGLYNVVARFAGFEPYIEYEVRTSTVKPVYFEIGLISSTYSLDEIVVSDEARKNTVVTPLSVQKVNWSELQRMPGAILDISKAIQSFPGVLPKSSFGYNIVIRGGAPNENTYYLDGIKIPAINHFSVQGASGGPNGLVNLDFVQDMEMYSGAFPANMPSGLSSVLDIRQREGRNDRLGARITLGYSDLGATIEGPIGQKSNFIASARYSFSQFLLKAFDVPVLPGYTDFQFRNKWQLDDKNELIITGIAGFDEYTLNTEAPESDALLYNVGYIPEGTQSVYAFGVNYKHFLKNSFYSFVVSRNGFTNVADKFRNNTNLEEDRLLDYDSDETEHHIRLEHNIYKGVFEFKYGATLDQTSTSFSADGYNVQDGIVTRASNQGSANFLEYGAFMTASRKFFNSRLGLVAGVRADASDAGEDTKNLLEHLSPRVSANYIISKYFSIKSTAGTYYQLPPEILIATNNSIPEGSSNTDYMRSNQASLGFEYRNRKTYRASIEGFYKSYEDYPFLLGDQISFANALGDFVAIGNQPSTPTSVGRAYGVEMFVQQKLKKNYWWMMAYTYTVSEFQDKLGNYRPSSWDSRHYLSITAGKILKRNWQLGFKWRYSNGTPYTPYDLEASSLISNWDVAQRGIFDFDRLNENRLPSFHQLDIRVDKSWWFGKWNLNLFIDMQNAYRSSIQLMPYLTTQRDENWQNTVDPSDPNRYLLKEIESDTGRMIYTIGLIAEF